MPSKTGNIVDLGSRLQSERKRLGKNQTEMARIGGVGRNSQVDYERGKTACSVAYLLALRDAGVDTDYVFSGVRMAGSLTNEQVALLESFDLLDDDERDALVRMVQVMAARRRPSSTVHASMASFHHRAG